MQRNIYKYIELIKESSYYFSNKYKITYPESLTMSIKVLLACLMSNNKLLYHHFTSYYLTTLDRLFKEHKEIKVLPYINDLNEVEVIVYYLNLKKFPNYLIGDILGLDGYYVANIIDSIDMKLMP